MTKLEIAKKVIIDSGGIAKTSMLLEAGLRRVDVCKLTNDGLIKRVHHGFYSLKNDSDLSEEKYIAKLIPEGIVCMESALFYYGYSDFTPRQWTIAVPRLVSQNKIKSNVVPIKPYYVQESVYELGKTTGKFDGTILPVYDKERTICDCFKYKNKMDNELFAKAINSYALDKNKNLINLSKYAKELKVYKKVIDTMEMVFNG